ncbi:MAG: hypothetical protein ACLFVG_04810 [Candidatus Aminicenantes bacterium]
MRTGKKKTLLIVLFCGLALILIYFSWLGFHLLSFKTYRSYPPSASPLEIEGVYHIHSTFSDGRKNIHQIADLAAQASVDFIILTDHGSPNRKSLAAQGWIKGVLVLAGSELSVSRGHLVGLDFNPPSRPFSQNAELAASEINEAGGFSIIAHPYSKVRWSWGEFTDYSGIEIMNADTMVKRNLLSTLPYLPSLLIKPQYLLLKMLDSPRRNLQKWDRLNQIHPLYGYFSVDAHFLYRPLLSLFHVHLFLARPLAEDFEQARRQVYKSLKRGHFYNAVHASARGEGFRFWAEKGKKKIFMGETAVHHSPMTLHIHAPFAFSKEIHLIRNGKIIHRSPKNRFSCAAREPGIYRVEIFLREKSPLAENIPWLVSNPIFLRKDKP